MITDEMATKNSIQYIAKRKVEDALCKLIDNTDMAIADILKCDELTKVATKATKIATDEIGEAQVILCVIALVSIGTDGETYEPLVACVDEKLKVSTLAGIYNHKKVLESKAGRGN